MWKRMNAYTKKRLIGDIAVMAVGIVLSIVVGVRLYMFATADVKYKDKAVITDIDKKEFFKNDSKYYRYRLTYSFTAGGMEYTYEEETETDRENAYWLGMEETIYIYSTDNGESFSHNPSMTWMFSFIALGILALVMPILDFKKEWGLAKKRWGDE